MRKGPQEKNTFLSGFVPVSSPRILLAEDYPVNQDVAKIHLEDAGYTVTIVENGKRAVAACQKETFDLIIMDLHMPEMDGLEATRLIRSSQLPCSDVTILALTADVDTTTQQACKEAGMNGFLTKPVRGNLLISEVEKWMSPSSPDGCVAGKSYRQSPNSSPQDDVPLDYAVVSHEFGDETVVSDIVGQFMETVETQIQDMQGALNSTDIDRLQRNAHAIKGGAATLEARPLSEAARCVEDLCKSRDVDGIPLMLNLLASEFDRLREYVSKENETAP